MGRSISTILILFEGEIEKLHDVVGTDFTKWGFIQDSLEGIPPCFNFSACCNLLRGGCTDKDDTVNAEEVHHEHECCVEVSRGRNINILP